MDDDLRELERKARLGDVRALLALQRARERCDPTPAERVKFLLEALALRLESEHGIKTAPPEESDREAPPDERG